MIVTDCIKYKEIDRFQYGNTLNLYNNKTWLSGYEKYKRSDMIGKAAIVFADDLSVGKDMFLEDGYGYTKDMLFKIIGTYQNNLGVIWHPIEVLCVL